MYPTISRLAMLLAASTTMMIAAPVMAGDDHRYGRDGYSHRYDRDDRRDHRKWHHRHDRGHWERRGPPYGPAWGYHRPRDSGVIVNNYYGGGTYYREPVRRYSRDPAVVIGVDIPPLVIPLR